MAEESMGDIQFHTTHKGDLAHYSYIFRKPYMLGEKLNNVACYRLGTLLYLEIQNGKEEMKK